MQPAYDIPTALNTLQFPNIHAARAGKGLLPLMPRQFPGLLELGVSFAVINYICLGFMQIHAAFYLNYNIYSGLLIFCRQNVAINYF